MWSVLALRPSDTASHEIQPCHQLEDRQDPRPRHPGNAVGNRRRGNSMKRRQFIAGLGSAAAVSPLAVRAQQPALPVIGFLGSQFADDYKSANVPFLQGLKETGYVQGRNVAIEYRYAENQYDRLPA